MHSFKRTLRLTLKTLLFLILFSNSNISLSQTKSSLITDYTSFRSNDEIIIGLRIKLDKDWYTYWENPGDTGLPIEFNISNSNSLRIEELFLPTPEKIKSDSLVSFGYKDEVIILKKLIIPPNFQKKSIKIESKNKWLICKEICIPKVSRHEIILERNDNKVKSNDYDIINLFLNKLSKNYIGGKITVEKNDKDISFHVPSIPNKFEKKSKLSFIPGAKSSLQNNFIETYSFTDNQHILTLSFQDFINTENISGLFIFENLMSNSKESYFIKTSDLKFTDNYSIKSSIKPLNISLFFAILFGFLGGFLLNLMPCVFPIISIKILSFINNAGKDIKVIKYQGLLFSLGIIISFLIISLFLLLLKSFDLQSNWGAQMQSPYVVSFLAILFLMIALNLSGLYELGTKIQSIGANYKNKSTYYDAFFSGTLATIVATPCTAPFMGVALGYAFINTSINTFFVFVSIGFGMASPYLILSFRPNMLRKIPKPGEWMNILKRVLSLPIFMTVIWLLWILTGQIGSDKTLVFTLGLLFLTFSVWLSSEKISSKKLKAFIFHPFLIIVFITSFLMFFLSLKNDSSTKKSQWKSWSSEAVSQLNNKPIFIDFTAKWCLTCQVNKNLVLNDTEVLQLFEKNKFTLFRADWTNYDSNITNELTKLGRVGIPVYVIYLPNKVEPILLPEILTKKILKQYILQNQ